ncbi:hypothetical protein WJX77_011586 [Trebouxia sp. C0004]
MICQNAGPPCSSISANVTDSSGLFVVICKSHQGTGLDRRGHGSRVHVQSSLHCAAMLGSTATTTLFDYASEVGLQLVHDKFASLKLPDTHTSWDIPVIGTINLDLSDIKLQSLDITSSSTGVSPNTQGGVTFVVNGLKTYVTCHFHYYKTSFPQVSGSGNADVRFEDGDVEYKLIPKADATGHPMIISQEPAQVAFGVIDVHTSHSSAAWLYNLFLTAFEGQFRGVITDEVSRQVTETLPIEVDNLLAGIPTIVDLQGLQFNTSLAGDPVVEPDRITVKDWGRFRLPSKECPYQRASTWISPASKDDKPPMFIADIDESIIDCFTWVLQERKALQKHFRSADVPIALQTDNWAGVVPNLPSQYPGQNMSLDVATAEPLLTTITAKGGVVVSGNATLMFALDSEDPELAGKPLFELGIQSEIVATKIWVESGQPDCDWRLMVEGSIRWLASSIAQKWINGQLLKKGFALPDIPYVQIQQPSIAFNEGYLSVAADVKYVP